MYERILVPLDGSGRSAAILPHVDELARAHGSKVLFLRVIEPARIMIGADESQVRGYIEDMERRANDARSELAGVQGEFRAKGIESEVLVATGPVVDSILETASQEDVELVAMASHGRGGLSRVFYGSTTAAVLARIDRPLLLIRSRRSEG